MRDITINPKEKDMSDTFLNKIESRPASNELIEDLARTFLDYRSHQHPQPGGGEDFFCLNLTSFMGERMGAVLARLREEMAKEGQA